MWISILKRQITGKQSEKRKKTTTYLKTKEYKIPKYTVG